MIWLDTHLVTVVISAAALLATLFVLQQRRTPQSAAAWLLFIVVVPWLALPLFLMLGFRKQGFPFRANLHIAYDVENREFQQQQIQLNWEGSCWSIGIDYRDLRLGSFPTRDWLIRISLKGIGALPEIRGSLAPVGN